MPDNLSHTRDKCLCRGKVSFNLIWITQQGLEPSVACDPAFEQIGHLWVFLQELFEQDAARNNLRRRPVWIEAVAIKQHPIVRRHDVLQPASRRRVPGEIRSIEGLQAVNDSDGVGDDFSAQYQRRHHGLRVQRNVPRFELFIRFHDVNLATLDRNALLQKSEACHLRAD